MHIRKLVVLATVAEVLLATVATAEYRVWTLQDGKTFNAEYNRKGIDLVFFQNEDGSEFKVPYNELCDADQKFVMLKNPPQIDIKVSPRNKTKTIGYGGYWFNSYRVQLEIVDPSITTKKGPFDFYTLPLSMDVVVVGKVRETERYIVLEYETTDFNLTGDNKDGYVYEANPIDLRKTDGDLYTGIDYYGIVVAVRDQLGSIIALESTRTNLKPQADKLLAAKPGALFNRNFRRIHPVRPSRSIPGRVF